MELSEVKKYFWKPVEYEGSVYVLSECILWLDRKARQFRYSCRLIDRNENSTICVPLEKVRKYDKQN